MKFELSRYPITQLVTLKNKNYLVKYLYDFNLAKLIEIVYMIDDDGRRVDDCLGSYQLDEIIIKINTHGLNK